MITWKEFEEEALRYLRRRYSDDGHVHFIKKGGSDSQGLDLMVTGRNKKELYLEVKSPKAQSGQFVLDINKNKFVFKPNKKRLGPTEKQIELINHINATFSTCNIDQSAMKINYDHEKTSDLIKEPYEAKEASYFITGDFEKKKVGIIPLDNISEAFRFEMTLRRKKSGSRELPLRDGNIAEKIIKKKFENLGIKILDFGRQKKKFIIQTNCDHKQKREFLYFNHHKNYFLSQSEKNLKSFELKVLSSTNNITVVYTSLYSGLIRKEWENKFLKDLENL